MSSSSGNNQLKGGKASNQGEQHMTSEGTFGPSFNSMYQQKRSNDPESLKRRESIAEQQPTGALGKLWQKYSTPAIILVHTNNSANILTTDT
ncbi:hypothetical protein F4779DRAFT_579143 [Xylariaceae sp. FL0662B]|nr:hypothetical protein F4779DRAFT_579143 [Xylariaceae sp. FL0662B]